MAAFNDLDDHVGVIMVCAVSSEDISEPFGDELRVRLVERNVQQELSSSVAAFEKLECTIEVHLVVYLFEQSIVDARIQLITVEEKMSEVRERFEWCRIWWDRDEGALPRTLLIGDSITNAYRPFVTEIIGDSYRVDMLATSKAVDSPALLREIDYACTGYGYSHEIIHFNNGIHGKHLPVSEYARWYEIVVLHLLQENPTSRIVLAYSTPFHRVDENGVFGQVEPLSFERNAAVSEIAAKYELEIDDLYGPSVDHDELHAPDGVHFSEDGSRKLAGIVASVVARP